MCTQMMHEGWEPERQRWEDATRASRSVQDIGNALAHLEDWIAVDYAPGSDVSAAHPDLVCLGMRLVAPGLAMMDI